jgi:hypothetical protein
MPITATAGIRGRHYSNITADVRYCTSGLIKPAAPTSPRLLTTFSRFVTSCPEVRSLQCLTLAGIGDWECIAILESRLDAIRQESATKLEEMRQTVDEKLQTTLESRLGESFNRVVEQLERVHKGIGEMQTLAANVGDLRNVLTNGKVRGTYGEVQLALLLEQFLSPGQFVKNASDSHVCSASEQNCSL